MFLDGEPLSWSTRVKIALDSARGLEYIHEHTVPTYIHRDIKSENILLDKNFCAKVQSVSITFFSLLPFFSDNSERPYIILFSGCRLRINQAD